MEKLVIDKIRDTIIVEKTNGNEVLRGSKFYCGCCGNVLGESKKKITFPFSVETFKNSLKNKTFDTMLFGLHHKTCGNTMFSFKKGYRFTKMETYIENVPQPCTELSTKHDNTPFAKRVLGAVKYKFWLHNVELLYSCKTDEKKNKYERGLKAKNVKYTLEVVGS